jgi:hypothetical protein
MAGEAKRRQTATQRFIAQYPDCCFCGGLRPATTREHMPQRSLFDGSHRPDKLVMPACDECNRGTSTADLTVALMSRWTYDSPPQEVQDHRHLANRIRRQAPDVAAEWNAPVNQARARVHLIQHGVRVPADAGLISFGPETVRYLNLFAHKAVLALYFEHFKRPLPNLGAV